MSKTLEQTAEEYKNDILYIGSASSFFLIGDYLEYQERIDELSEYFKKAFAKTLSVAEHEALRIISEIHRLTKDPDMEQERMLKSLCSDYIRVFDERTRARERQAYFEANPDLRKRKVKCVTNRINDGERGKHVVIEGYEYGKYWTKKEYDGRKNADNKKIKAEKA